MEGASTRTFLDDCPAFWACSACCWVPVQTTATHSLFDIQETLYPLSPRYALTPRSPTGRKDFPPLNHLFTFDFMNPEKTCKLLLTRLTEDIAQLDRHAPNFSWYAELCLRAALYDDDLPLLVDIAWDTFKERMCELCEDKQLSWAEAFDEQGYDLIWEVADQHTPMLHWIIRSLYYLYSDELEEAYSNAGIYSTPPDNYQQVCICLYIEQELMERAHFFTNANAPASLS